MKRPATLHAPTTWYAAAASKTVRALSGDGVGSFCLFAVGLYALYRSLACERWRWECRQKTARVNAEDTFALVLFSLCVFTLGGFDPIPPVGSALAARYSDPPSASSEEELPLGAAAAARAPWAATLRGWVTPRATLRLAGSVAAVSAAFILGHLGEGIKLDIEGLPAGVLAPCATVVAVAFAWAATVALRKPGAAWGFLCRLLAVAAFWGISAAIAARGGGGGGGGSGKGCAVLVLHAHHFFLGLSGILLLREHGLPPPFRLSWQRVQLAFGVFTFLVKNALLGVAVHGISQYGPDSVLRRTTCAVNR